MACTRYPDLRTLAYLGRKVDSMRLAVSGDTDCERPHSSISSCSRITFRVSANRVLAVWMRGGNLI